MKIAPRNTWIFVLSQFFSAFFFTIPIWIPFYQARITVEQISFLVAYQYAVQMFLELPSGALADLIGRKWTVVIGYIALAISNLFVVFSPGFWMIFVGATLAGISDSFISGSLEALVYDSCKQDKVENKFGQALAKSGFWYQIALAIGTLAGGFLYHIHPSVPFLLHSAFVVVAVILSLLFIEPKIDSEKFSVRNYLKQIKEGAHEVFRSRTVALMSLFYIAVGGITWPNQLYFNSFMMVELGFSAEQRSVIGAALRILNIFILTKLLKNEKIFTRKRAILFFPIMMLIGFLPAIFFQGWWSLPFLTVALMAGTARWIVLTPYTNALFSSKYRATAISALSMLVGFIYIFITLLSGPIIENLGGVKTVFSLMGLLTLFTVVPLTFALLKHQKPTA